MEAVAEASHIAPRAPKANAEMTLTLDDDGALNISDAERNDQKEVIVWATQQGRTQYAQLTVMADVVSGVDSVTASSQVLDVTYYNLTGVKSDKPFDGVNVVVTRYTDGTQRTTKVVY